MRTEETFEEYLPNAPGTVYALKLYAATGDGRYLKQGKGLYAWTKEHLLDTGGRALFR